MKVHIVSTTSDPLGDGPAQRRIRGVDVIIIPRPPAVVHYQKNNYDVELGNSSTDPYTVLDIHYI